MCVVELPWAEETRASKRPGSKTGLQQCIMELANRKRTGDVKRDTTPNAGVVVHEQGNAIRGHLSTSDTRSRRDDEAAAAHASLWVDCIAQWSAQVGRSWGPTIECGGAVSVREQRWRVVAVSRKNPGGLFVPSKVLRVACLRKRRKCAWLHESSYWP